MLETDLELVSGSGSLVGLVVSKVLVRTGFESRWSRFSVAVLVAYLVMLSL